MKVEISTPFIKLDSLLKFSGVADSGSVAKELIAAGFVTYNGDICLMRGKKVYPGDKISVTIPDELKEEICVE